MKSTMSCSRFDGSGFAYVKKAGAGVRTGIGAGLKGSSKKSSGEEVTPIFQLYRF